MAATSSISVLMPTRNGEAFLDRVLRALAEQQSSRPWDFHAVDSGSTDRTLAIFETWRTRFPVPMRISTIHPSEFSHGDTRNLLAAESIGDILVFLTQDAIPAGPSWLETLVRNFDDPRVGAAYSRNIPRPDAGILTRLFSENDPGYTAGRREQAMPDPRVYAAMDPHQRRLLYNFNNVASALRRSLWERHPFPRTEFGEDLLMARAIIEAGYAIAYEDSAPVEHSHDYAPEEMAERARIDGRFNIEWLNRVNVSSLQDAETLAERQLERDRQALIDEGVKEPELGAELAFAERHRRAAFVGMFEGGRSSVRRPASRMRSSSTLRVLYVVHGFPPDTWAGTEVYTLELAHAIRSRGHDVAVLTRAPAPLGPLDSEHPDFSIHRADFQGLPVYRMTNRLQHGRLRDSYLQPKAEAAFRTLLDEQQPDIVHFQHLIHLSVGLPRVCRERGIATIMTVNDYWALCARVQLIRPDGVRCEENQGLGCLLCVKERRYDKVPAARRWLPVLRPLARAADRLREIPALRPFAEAGGELEDIATRHDIVCGGYATCDQLIAPSRFLRQKLVDTGKFDPHAVVYSDYGMRQPDLAGGFSRRPDPAGRVRFGFIGSLLWYKGVDVLVQAFGMLDPAKAVLNMYGDFRPETDAFHASLSRLAIGSGDAVHFHGRFDNKNLSRVYEQIDVLVVPSTWFENSPLTIHESFMFRTPVVTSDIGGMAELVGHGANGLLFRAGDAGDLAATLRRFLEEPGLAETLTVFPRIKTIEEDARLMEVRYRAATCLVREHS